MSTNKINSKCKTVAFPLLYLTFPPCKFPGTENRSQKLPCSSKRINIRQDIHNPSPNQYPGYLFTGARNALSLALVHKHVKMSVFKCILESTRPHKHVQILSTDAWTLC